VRDVGVESGCVPLFPHTARVTELHACIRVVRVIEAIRRVRVIIVSVRWQR
jgi:hypothetical protein